MEQVSLHGGADDRFLSSASSLDRQATNSDGLPHYVGHYTSHLTLINVNDDIMSQRLLL